MDKFTALFGVPAGSIQEHCLLLPLLTPLIAKGFDLKRPAKGMLYAVENRPGISFIRTGMGAGLAGDAVLYLGDTACKTIVLFGSCGLLKETDGLKLGGLVCPSASHAYESFSGLLEDSGRPARVYYPDRCLLEKLTACGLGQAVCATLGSLKLEEELLDLFAAAGIDLLDMECSAVLAAAQRCRIPAAAVFYISDVVAGRKFYQPLSARQRICLAAAVGLACKKILLFCRG